MKGNERIIKNMRSSVINNTISHAYIIDGQRGSGKKLLANAFAKAMLCPCNNNGESCGVCRSCIAFDTRNNPDVIYVSPQNSKSAGVGDIRGQVADNAGIKPFLWKYKIFIIDNADSMTTAAQNSLLKTLEEPAYYCVFLLLTKNLHSLLPTVLSRAVIFRLKPVDFLTVKAHIISKANIDTQTAHFCAVYSQGNIGRALEIAESKELAQMRGGVISLLQRISERDIVDVLLSAKQLENFKDNISGVLDIMSLWYRDIVVLTGTKNSSFVIQQDIIQVLLEEASNSSTLQALSRLNSVEDARRRISQNGNFTLTMELMLVNIKGAAY